MHDNNWYILYYVKMEDNNWYIPYYVKMHGNNWYVLYYVKMHDKAGTYYITSKCTTTTGT